MAKYMNFKCIKKLEYVPSLFKQAEVSYAINIISLIA